MYTNDAEAIIKKLVSLGNNPDWARKAVYLNIAYVNRIYGKIPVSDAADIIRTIDE